MSVETLLAEIEAAGGHVEARGDVLDVEAPHPLPEHLIEELRRHKEALLTALRNTASNGLEVIHGVPRVPGRTLRHPWRGRTVVTPEVRGVLVWTDGWRAAIETEQNVAVLVDLVDVRLVEGG